VFNRGGQPLVYTAKADQPWVELSSETGTVKLQENLTVSINWAKAPKGTSTANITIADQNGLPVTIALFASNMPKLSDLKGFVEVDGYIAMEAAHYTRAINTNGITWENIPGYGRTLSGVTIFPVTAKSQTPGGNSPHLQYQVNVTDTGNFKIQAYISPTIDFTNTHGLHYAISVDNEQPQIVDITPDNSEKAWGKSVADNIKILTTQHHINKPGVHTINYWMVDPAVVLQRLVLDFGGVQPSYLGPPESYFK
jgi:hypothetical protein